MKTPLKGRPYFGKINTEKLKEFEDFIQEMIFSYKNAEDIDKIEVLEKIYKDISVELIDRSAHTTKIEKKVLKRRLTK